MDLEDQFLAEPGAELPADAPKGAEKLLEAIRVGQGKTPEQLAEETGEKDLHRLLRYLMECGAVRSEINDRRRVLDERVTMVRPAPDFEPRKPLTKKQELVLAVLEEFGSVSVKELCYYSGVTRIVVENLRKAGAVELYEQIVYRDPYAGRDEEPQAEPILLTDAQQAAYDTILAGDPGKPALLYGVTGSGKTQVFLRLIDQTLAEGRRAIVMVPEISLTPQVHRAVPLAGTAAVPLCCTAPSPWGSAPMSGERIRDGGADIIIGTRSAVFAPVENLGLIVIDEEQERTYQSEVLSAVPHGGGGTGALPVPWGTAAALLGYAVGGELSCRPHRAIYLWPGSLNGIRASSPMSPSWIPPAPNGLGESSRNLLLRTSCSRTWRWEQQSILLLNRRGYHTVMKCSSCGEAVTCPNCSVAMTYHRQNGRLMCHYCGHTQRWSRRSVPTAAVRMVRFSGIGTQKAEEELAAALSPGPHPAHGCGYHHVPVRL